MKKVSIIVPIYNVELYLKECLDSLVNQTYNNLEIILIDDGATDNSGIICDNYAMRDSRIMVIHQKNAGAANAKNSGLDVMTGDYFTFVDSDDYVELDWIESMVSYLECNNVDAVECLFTQEYMDKSEMIEEKNYKFGLFDVETYMSDYLNCWISSLLWNKLFKSDLTKNIRFRKERRCIDDEFYTYKVLSNAKRIARVNDAYYHYRQRKSSAVRSEKNQLQITDDALEVLIERYKWIKIRFPKLAEVYLKHDIEILHYFVDSLIFNVKLKLKLYIINLYYSFQSIKIRKFKYFYIGVCLFKYVFKINKKLISKKHLDDYYI